MAARLSAGGRVGSYEVLAALGEGGMGAVYRAHDTKLNRDVALKVLLPEVADNPERLARFRREAQILASLNHPNIAHIHGLEESDGVVALVLELVEGPTLGDRIAKGPIPLDEALPIAKQIAEALEAAHEQAVIHRDLKPANIKVRDDGTVKVLDFGLAKAMEPVSGSLPPQNSALSNSPTLMPAAVITSAGVLLGTAAYMAPEQARGHRVDKRTDIWAFGCVLFEMLTGNAPFCGQNVAESIACIMRDEPRWELLPVELPPAIVKLLHRCLAKDAKQRLPDVAVARLELDDVRSGQVEQAKAGRRGAAWSWAPWAVTAVLGALLVWSVSQSRSSDTPPGVVSRLSVPIDAAPSSTLGHLLAISPDGRSLVYVSNGQLFRRYIDELISQPLAGTAGSPIDPVFSPDGRWIAYQDQGAGTLKKVGIEGGSPTTLLTGVRSGLATVSWDSKGILIEDGQVTRVAIDGSQRKEEVPVTVPDGLRLRHPTAVGDGLLFNLDAVGGQTLGFAGRGQSAVSLAPGYDPRFLPTGHLLWARDGVLLAAGFDPGRGTFTTSPVAVVRGVAQAPSGLPATSYHAISQTGTLAYIPGVSPDEPKSLISRDREGRDTSLEAPQRSYFVPRLSPDGGRIALSLSEAGDDLWVWDIKRHSLQHVTSGDAIDSYGVWTPDGTGLVYSSTLGAARRLVLGRADGAGESRVLLEDTDTVFPNAITRDGRDLIFSGGQHGVRMMPLAGGESRLVTGPSAARSATLSPDDRFIAYQSSESGVAQVYVRPYPDAQRARWQVSTDGGTRPVWAHSGREIFYVNQRNQLVSVSVEFRAEELVAGEPQVLFDVSDSLSAAYRNFDVSLDDQRFILPKGAPVLPSNQIVVVQHWFEELKRLVPAK